MDKRSGSTSPAADSGSEEENLEENQSCCCNLVCCFEFVAVCGCKDCVVRQLLFLSPPPMYTVLSARDCNDARIQLDRSADIERPAPRAALEQAVEMTQVRGSRVDKKAEDEVVGGLRRINLDPVVRSLEEIQAADLTDDEIFSPISARAKPNKVAFTVSRSASYFRSTGFIQVKMDGNRGRIHFDLKDRLRNRFPVQAKCKDCMGRQLFLRMAHQGKLPIDPEQLEELRLGVEYAKPSDVVPVRPELANVYPENAHPAGPSPLLSSPPRPEHHHHPDRPPLLSNHTAYAHESGTLREINFDGLWHVGQILHRVLVDDQTWFLLEWENPHPSSDCFTRVHKEYVRKDAPFLRPIQSDVFCVLDYLDRPISPVLSGQYLSTQLLRNGNVFTLFVTPSRGKSKVTIIHSHGNGSDLGIMMSQYFDLAQNLDVNVLGYDYSGYGMSGRYGKSTVEKTFLDINAVWEYATHTLGLDPKHVFLYGQSLGSGPTTNLAVSLSKQNVEWGGLILHAPLASGLRVVAPVQETSWFDIYPNIDLIANVQQTPIFILQGTVDDVVDVSHGRALAYVARYNSSSKVEEWFPQGGNHNDIEVKYRPEYLGRLKKFIRSSLRRYNVDYNESKQLQEMWDRAEANVI